MQQSSGCEEVTGANVLVSMFAERESHAVYFLQVQDMTRFDAVNYINQGITKAPGRTFSGRERPLLSRNLEKSLHRALAHANERRHEYATLEHLLLALTDDQDAVAVLRACSVDLDRLRRDVLTYVDNELTNLVSDHSDDAKPTARFQRVLQRAVTKVGRRFAAYVVADAAFATAPFLHGAGDLGLRVVARLKDNLPTLYAAAVARFTPQPAHLIVEDGGARLELWDADDFDPWETLRWPTVRVLRYRQHTADGRVVEAYWLTDFPAARVGSRLLYRCAKAAGRSKTRASTTARPATAWSTSGTTTPIACW